MAYQATSGLMSTASAAAAIARDPYLPETVDLVLRLKESESSSGSGAGVGLRNVVGPLRVFVKTQENPWMIPTAVTVIAGSLFALGYFTRKKMSRG